MSNESKFVNASWMRNSTPHFYQSEMKLYCLIVFYILKHYLSLREVYILFFYVFVICGESRRGGTKCDCKLTGCGFDSPLEEMNIYLFKICISISSLWCWDKGRRWVPSLNTQCLQNFVESRERSVLTLGSLRLSFCVGKLI